jgi:hypothetical protein
MARTDEEKRKLEQEQQSINKIGDELTNPETRKKYDARNVHLSFFSVRKGGAPVWEDRARLLSWMHQAARNFLLERGEAVEPVTDLERTDFTADFTANELLERLLRTETEGGHFE